MHPKVKWGLIILGLIVLVAPTLGAELVMWGIDGVQGAIHSLQIFGDHVIPKK